MRAAREGARTAAKPLAWLLRRTVGLTRRQGQKNSMNHCQSLSSVAAKMRDEKHRLEGSCGHEMWEAGGGRAGGRRPRGQETKTKRRAKSSEGRDKVRSLAQEVPCGNARRSVVDEAGRSRSADRRASGRADPTRWISG